ncbi:hypothetical protein HXX76_014630 [Chlamydomonas incerta]|uniref:Uncharacterized protein n=1 Tax=Chlamydomonas incerta TaxID=51695 RepID=A0A835SG77_CHLIN|nr:hypothetical protein HXX76_014630 [Chlamydomonas incerta]|eukprot:KAG2424247.1 hypothetical protein HXX76_014630 [Chlamydomonas incerta]
MMIPPSLCLTGAYCTFALLFDLLMAPASKAMPGWGRAYRRISDAGAKLSSSSASPLLTALVPFLPVSLFVPAACSIFMTITDEDTHEATLYAAGGAPLYSGTAGILGHIHICSQAVEHWAQANQQTAAAKAYRNQAQACIDLGALYTTVGDMASSMMEALKASANIQMAEYADQESARCLIRTSELLTVASGDVVVTELPLL